MIRYWLNLETLRHRCNDMEWGPSKTDAQEWLEPESPGDLGWFTSAEAMQQYIAAEVLPMLEKAWANNPEWRLGQLICNSIPKRLKNDPYYLSDRDLLERLRQHAGG